MQDSIQYKIRVTENKKNKDWYKWFVDYFVPYTTSVPSRYTKMKRIYDLLNNDLTGFKKEMDMICRSQLTGVMSMPDDFEEDFVMYNRIFSKASYLVGEMLKRGDEYAVVPLSHTAQQEIEEEYARLIDALIQEVIMKASSGEEYSLPEPSELEKGNFHSKHQLFLTRVIDFFKYKFDIKELKRLSFWHVLASDTVIVGIVEEGGKPVPKVFNPLHCGWHKSPDKVEIEKGDYFWYKTAITIGEAIDEIGDDVTEEELNRIVTFSDTRYGAKKSHGPGGKAELSHFAYDLLAANQDTHDKTVGQGQGAATSRRYHADRLLWKTYIQFKAYRRVIFLTTIDEYGMDKTVVVPDNFDIPEDAEKSVIYNRYGRKNTRFSWSNEGTPTHADLLWIPRRYEVTRYGSDYYHNYREMPNQPVDLEDPYNNFELSIKGRTFSSVNSEPVSLVERAVNSQLQYIFAKTLESREMAKYEGAIKDIDASLIPDDLHLDEDGEPIWPGADKLAVHVYLTKMLGKNYYNGSQNSGGLINYNKSPGTRVSQSGYFSEISNIQQFCELLDREIGLQMMVPPQAEAIVSPYSNASDNQQAIQQGYTMAEGYYVMFEQVFKKLVGEYLRQFQQYHRNFFMDNPDIKQSSLFYISSEGQNQVLKVTPEMIDFEDMGLFLADTTYSERYRRYMESVGVAIAQNQAENAQLYSTIFKSLAKGDSPERIHTLIQEVTKRQEKQQQELQQQQQQAQQQAAMMQQQTQQMAQQFEMQKLDREKMWDMQIKSLEADADEIPKEIEQMMAMQDMNIKEREQSRKEKETDEKIKTKNVK